MPTNDPDDQDALIIKIPRPHLADFNGVQFAGDLRNNFQVVIYGYPVADQHKPTILWQKYASDGNRMQNGLIDMPFQHRQDGGDGLADGFGTAWQLGDGGIWYQCRRLPVDYSNNFAVNEPQFTKLGSNTDVGVTFFWKSGEGPGNW